VRVPAAIRAALSLLAVTAILTSCTGDGSTLDPRGAPLGPPEVAVSPARVDLSLIEGTGKAVEITVTNAGGLPLRVESVTSSAPFLSPAFAAPVQLRSGAEVVVDVQVTAASSLASPQDGSIQVVTNDPRVPVLDVPVHVVVTAGPRPEIGVEPDSLTARVAPDGSDARTLRIRNTGTGDLHVSDITVPSFLSPGITTATVPVDGFVDVVITADAAGLAVGNHLGAVTIASDDEDEPVLAVPFLLRVESPFPATLEAIQEYVFTPRCASEGCHAGAFPMVGLMLTGADSSYASMVNVTSIEVPSLKIVKPGDAANSYLVVKIVPSDPRRSGLQMPATGPALAPDVIEVIRRWIDEGAERN